MFLKEIEYSLLLNTFSWWQRYKFFLKLPNLSQFILNHNGFLLPKGRKNPLWLMMIRASIVAVGVVYAFNEFKAFAARDSMDALAAAPADEADAMPHRDDSHGGFGIIFLNFRK